MKGILNSKQIEYVFLHFRLQFDLPGAVEEYFCFQPESKPAEAVSKGIIFPLSEQKYTEERVLRINDIPVLFPVSQENEAYSFENGILRFNHDFLKSAFYLLSGYQETQDFKADRFNRFPFEDSVQKKLAIVEKPVVNYYFQYIYDGIKYFCEQMEIQLPSEKNIRQPEFLLTHDVDIVDTYTFRDVLFRLKRIMMPGNSGQGFAIRTRYFFKYLFNYLNFINRKNPHWDFEYLLSAARGRGFKSVFYFLQKGARGEDSRYSFSELRLKLLFTYVLKNGSEIGLHGATGSATSLDILKGHKEILEINAGIPVSGIRQHRLIHKHLETSLLQEEAGFLYDATLGYAEHEGFRNSFCLPFKLYDFENDRIPGIWQIPLVVMDATIFMYRKLDFESAYSSVLTLIEECEKFNGLFTLLWHNGNFDEEGYPFGKELFEGILDTVKEKNFHSSCPVDYINDISSRLEIRKF